MYRNLPTADPAAPFPNARRVKVKGYRYPTPHGMMTVFGGWVDPSVDVHWFTLTGGWRSVPSFEAMRQHGGLRQSYNVAPADYGGLFR